MRIRLTLLFLAALTGAAAGAALSAPVAAAPPTQTSIQNLGREVLRVVFAFGGVAAALAGAVSGVRLIVNSALSSGYGVSQAVGSLLVALIGLALMIAGPDIARAVISAVPVSVSTPGLGGDWSAAVGRWIVILMQIGAVIAAVGISWNSALLILDAAFGGSPTLSVAIMQRILGSAVALAVMLAAPGIVSGLYGLLF